MRIYISPIKYINNSFSPKYLNIKSIVTKNDKIIFKSFIITKV